MSFERIIGQDQATQLLQNALEKGSLAHALLFAGPAGVGKRMAADEVARALLCREGPSSSCGKCPSCHRVDIATHGDLYVVEPEPGRSGITIQQVRDLGAALSESPMEGERKAAIIDPADSMTTEAQNCLLKTLEEPPADTTLLLIAENTDLLLPTVRSRCRRVNFRPLDAELIERLLIERGEEAESAAVLARVARGSLRRALELSDGAAASERTEILEALAGKDEIDHDVLADMLSGGGGGSLKERRERATLRLETLHSFLVDCMRVSAGGAPGTNLDMRSAVERFAGRRDFDELTHLEKELVDAIILIEMFADVRLATQRVAAAFARVQPADMQ